MAYMQKILVVARDVELCRKMKQTLEPLRLDIEFTESGEDALSRIVRDERYSVLLLDFELTSSGGAQTVDRAMLLRPKLPVILLSDCPASPTADLKDRKPSCPVLLKPLGREQLLSAISNLVGTAGQAELSPAEQPACHALHEEAATAGTWSQRIESLLTRIGSADVPVLLQGETGVGKEVIARKLHAYSKRAAGPFVKLNCAALPSELVESELFGYERGAFTGAFKSTPGKFEMAHKGTILLDEIGDMDMKLQAKLLQVLQDKEFYRLGSHETSRIDVRIMAASHCDFEKAIAEKRFREDLYYRLNIVDIKIPPLRERRSEILPLSELFLQKHATAEWPRIEMDPILRQVLLEYNWPGNIRELENIMRKYLVLRSPSILAAEIRQRTVRTKTVYVPAEELGKPMQVAASNSGEIVYARRSTDMPGRQKEPIERVVEGFSSRPGVPHEICKVQELRGPTMISRSNGFGADDGRAALSRVDEARRAAEAEAILHALQSSLWNRKQAAKLLNVDYKALLYKMKKLGIGEKKAASF